MRKIWKIRLGWVRAVQNYDLPVNAKVVSCGVQNNLPVVWVDINEGNKKEVRQFRCYETGEQVEPRDEFVGTVTLDSRTEGRIVLHIFEHK